jgi:hypothetical protein
VTIKLNSENVYHYLINLNVCQEKDLKSIKIELKSSSIFMITLLDYQLFIKQDYYDREGNISKIIRNEWEFNRFLRSCPDSDHTVSFVPEILHFDESNSIIIYKYPKDYIDLESYYKKHKHFPIPVAELVGTTLATLHRETFYSQNYYDFTNKAVEGKCCHRFPYPSHLLDRVNPETLSKFPSNCFSFFTFYQRDEHLRSAVTELVAHHKHCCLTHNNPRLNNIFIPSQWDSLFSKIKQSDESIIKIINWENCSWDDPIFDLGIAISGYLLLWLNSLIVHPDIELNKSLQIARIPLEVVQPSIVALTKAYISNFPQITTEYPDFFKRIIQFTGLALIYQVLAIIQSQQHFDNQGLCILQLAKSLLCQPGKSFESVFGVADSEFVDVIPSLN